MQDEKFVKTKSYSSSTSIGIESLPQTPTFLSLYQRVTPSGCSDIGFRKTEFVAKPQFLSGKTNC